MYNQNLLHTQNNIDFAGQYSYQTTVQAMELANENFKAHLLFTAVDLSTGLAAAVSAKTGVAYNAPIGSVLFQYYSSTPTVSVKLTDGSWATHALV